MGQWSRSLHCVQHRHVTCCVHAYTCMCLQAVSGTYTSQQFDPVTSDFALSFAANTTLYSQPTLIYLNEKLYYPNGYVVRLVT